MTCLTHSDSERISILHLIDSLAIGGAEKVCVNLVNSLPSSDFDIHLGTTRGEGALAATIAPHVKQFRLERRSRFDLRALMKLVNYIRINHIVLIHAHSTSIFLARAAAIFCPKVSIVWHDHYGLHEIRERSVLLFRAVVFNISGVITVNQQLATWAVDCLRVPAQKVHYIHNFITVPPQNIPLTEVPGKKGGRIVCLANLRPQKDHITLVKAMNSIIGVFPDVHLILVGGDIYSPYGKEIVAEITRLQLGNWISLLGEREDIASILQVCDIGVLSSSSEGLPLALLEYGAAQLAVVCTNVGQCAEVLNHGQFGLLAPPKSPDLLAHALITLLSSLEKRSLFSSAFREHILENYSTDVAINEISRIYTVLLK